MEILSPIINAVISGVILGSLYAVMSMGLTLIYGVGRIFNFAHGAFVIWGGYFAWFLHTRSHMNYAASFILAIVLLFILGWLIDRFLLYPIRKTPNFGINAIIVTLGLAILLGNAGDVLFGTRFKRLDKLFAGILRIGDFTITHHDLATLLIAVGILLTLEIFLRKTTVGTAIRAISQDPAGAKIVGINLDRLYAFTFALAAVLGGISGVLLAPRFFITPVVGWETLFKAVIIVIFGGLGSIKGTLASAFILGMLEAFVSMYLGMFWVTPMWFMLLILVLFVKPRGLFGTWA
jgi:branched-chain amino acid transport system permease protein